MIDGVPSTAPIRPHPMGPTRTVPDAVARPYYVDAGGRPSGRPVGLLKDAGSIARLRDACAAVRRVLDRVGAAVAPGMSTDDLDAIAHDAYVNEGGYPSPLGYRGFPKSICT